MSKNDKEYDKIEQQDNKKTDNNGEEVSEKKEVRKPKEKIVDVEVTKRKKGLMERLVTGVLGPDGLPSIGSYLNEEIVVPAVKNIIVDAVTSGINMAIFGDTKQRNGQSQGSRATRGEYKPKTNYTSQYTSHQPAPRSDNRIRGIKHSVDEYIIEDRMNATSVLTSLQEHADYYDTVAVADYYDLIGVPYEHTDINYGWTFDAIVKATVVPVRGGYVLRFPAVEVIS